MPRGSRRGARARRAGRGGSGRGAPTGSARPGGPAAGDVVAAPLPEEPLQVTRDRVARGKRPLGVLLAAGRLLEALDERLHLGVALDGDVDLALVVGGRRLELGGIDGNADEALELAHERE